MANRKSRDLEYGKAPIFLAIFLASVVTPMYAVDVKLASYFGDHMVVQRDRKICVWGTGDPGVKVEVILVAQKAATMVGAAAIGKFIFHPCPQAVRIL